MNHDRVHAREPSHHVDRWSVGVIESLAERDGHCVVTVRPIGDGGDDREAGSDAQKDIDGDTGSDGDDGGPGREGGESVDLVVTLAVRDLFVSRLSIDDGESSVGERVWYRKRGG